MFNGSHLVEGPPEWERRRGDRERKRKRKRERERDRVYNTVQYSRCHACLLDCDVHAQLGNNVSKQTKGTSSRRTIILNGSGIR